MGLTDYPMQTKHIERNGTDTAGVIGLHRVSMSDIRSPKARQLEREIVAFLEKEGAKIREARREVGRCMAIGDALGERQAREIREAMKRTKHRTLSQMYDGLRDISLVHDVTVKNIIPTAGRAVIARWIIGDNTYDADDGANYGSLGTSSTAPANGDTTLTTETYRKARSSEARSSNVATLSNFYTATEVTGTFEEAGWHIDGTASANSGQLLSHFLTTTTGKTNQQTLTVESVLTIL